LESQRVKLLTEGYLRGWLSFQYPNYYSYLREDIVLNYIHDERLALLLDNKLKIETSIKSAILQHKNVDLTSIDNLASYIIDLKLPLIKSKDRIKEEKKSTESSSLTEADIEQFKKELAALQFSKDNA
jgi:hypothetical protein